MKNKFKSCVGCCGILLLTTVLAGAAEWDKHGNYKTITGPIFRVLENNKWGFINKSGELVIPATFETSSDFSEGIACVSIDNLCFLIREDGTRIPLKGIGLVAPFREGRAFCNESSSKVYASVIDKDGNVIAGPFDNFEPYSDGWALVNANDHWFYIDRDGKNVMDTTNTIHSAPEQRSYNAGEDEKPTMPHSFVCGRSRIFMNHEQWAYIDKTGNVVIPARYERACDFSEEFARVRLDGKWGYIKTDGTWLVEPHYEDARDFSDGMAAVRLDGKWGYLDIAGKLAIAPQFEKPQRFQEGMALIFKGSRVGFMDKQGKTVIEPRFSGAREFQDGLAMVWEGTKRGYINTAGEYVYARNTIFAP